VERSFASKKGKVLAFSAEIQYFLATTKFRSFPHLKKKMPLNTKINYCFMIKMPIYKPISTTSILIGIPSQVHIIFSKCLLFAADVWQSKENREEAMKKLLSNEKQFQDSQKVMHVELSIDQGAPQ